MTNAALVRARRLLRKGTMSPEQVYLKYREWREEEVRGEEAAVRAVRDDAWGMADAERPCCMDGEGWVHVGKGGCRADMLHGW